MITLTFRPLRSTKTSPFWSARSPLACVRGDHIFRGTIYFVTVHTEHAGHASTPQPHVRGNSEQSGYPVLRPDSPHCEGQGRPDIVILNEEAKKAYLVDVAFPWGSEENLKVSSDRPTSYEPRNGTVSRVSERVHTRDSLVPSHGLTV